MDFSPWLYGEMPEIVSTSLNSEMCVEISTIDKSIMTAIEDLASASDENSTLKANSLLLEVSSHHPLLILRHAPLLLRILTVHMFRLNKRVQSESKDDTLTATAYGSGAVKIAFNIAPQSALRSSLIWQTWLKCMKTINTRGLNEGIDTVLRKICARQGLMY